MFRNPSGGDGLATREAQYMCMSAPWIGLAYQADGAQELLSKWPDSMELFPDDHVADAARRRWRWKLEVPEADPVRAFVVRGDRHVLVAHHDGSFEITTGTAPGVAAPGRGRLVPRTGLWRTELVEMAGYAHMLALDWARHEKSAVQPAGDWDWLAGWHRSYRSMAEMSLDTMRDSGVQVVSSPTLRTAGIIFAVVRVDAAILAADDGWLVFLKQPGFLSLPREEQAQLARSGLRYQRWRY
jgi:hypothetical protein